MPILRPIPPPTNKTGVRSPFLPENQALASGLGEHRLSSVVARYIAVADAAIGEAYRLTQEFFGMDRGGTGKRHRRGATLCRSAEDRPGGGTGGADARMDNG